MLVSYMPKLLIPVNDEKKPTFSIVVPALNEEVTIEKFISWCKEGVALSKERVEILIIDSSSDKTAEIAQKSGARVLIVPKRGLGQAYKDAIPYIRGEFIIMGDADCTYDFRQIPLFVEKYQQGFEFVMGSRFKGNIETNAMPKLHQYFGTPVSTFCLNLIFRAKYSDIFCGMRGITTKALKEMNLRSRSWEYASEMVLKASHLDLKVGEVPINFFKDTEGRFSHMKRNGFLEPWKAGWINLKAMLIYGADFFLVKPGIFLFLIGSILVLPLSFGPIIIDKVSFALSWMLLGLCMSSAGINFFFFGMLNRLLFDYRKKSTAQVEKIFDFDRTITGAFLLYILSFLLMLPLLKSYLENNFVLIDEVRHLIYLSVSGLYFFMIASSLFCFIILYKSVIYSKEE